MTSRNELWDRSAFLAALRAVGRDRYHDRHPFHRRMNDGRLTPAQLRGWAANRFYYQRNLPAKDAAIVSNCPVREIRRAWLQRIIDHDGRAPGEGGIEAWLRLAEATGLSRDEVLDGRHVLPGVRFAVDAYVQFARTKPWPVAVASSLTELFAPDLMADRLAAFRTHYAWIPDAGLEYFRARITQARQDSDHGLEITLTHCDTPELQREAVAALAFKCDLLWAMLDSMTWAFGGGGMTTADRPRLAAKTRLRADRVRGGHVLLYPEGVLQLSPTAAAILALCDGTRDVTAVADELADRYAAAADRVRGDVVVLLERLRDRGLVTVAEGSA